MNWNDIRLRLRALLYRDRVEQELREELEQHIELQTRKHIRQGMPEGDARRRAVIKFGGEARVAEECRDQRRVTFIEHLGQDLRYAGRMFRGSPLFTATAVLLLALGTGATTTVFSLAYRVIQESLPVSRPSELVELYNEDRVQKSFQAGFSNPGFQLFSKKNQVFSEMFAFTDTFKVTVASKGTAEFAEVVFQTPNMDSALGLRPAVGRLINNSDADGSTGNAPAVLSFSYWQKRFGGDPTVIGETISINNVACVIVGVAPREFRGMIMGVSPDVILPLQVVERVRRVPLLSNGANLGLNVIGRRKPDFTERQIHDSLEPLYRSFLEQAVSSFPPGMTQVFKETTAKWQLRIRPASSSANSDVQSDLHQSLTILVSIAALVFLVGCTNLVGLLLARTEVRSKELRTRLAIGCSRGRLIRQMITESMVLAAMGGVVGLAISVWGRPVLLGLLTSRAPAINISFDAMTPILASGLSILAGLLLGFVPAVSACRILQKVSAADLSRVSRSNGRRAIVVTQVAASLALLVVAGQFALSLRNYRNINPGFRPDHLVLFETSVPNGARAYAQQVRERLSQLPGVVVVSHSMSPVGQPGWTTPIQVPGFQSPTPGPNLTGRNIVGPRFVETLGLRLRSGRDIQTTDTRERPSVAVVNEAFADYYFKGQDPIGRTFSFIDSLDRPHTIVGVVSDARDRGLKTLPAPMAYSSFEHDPFGAMTFAVRIRRDTEGAVSEIASAVRQVDPRVPVTPMRTMEAQMDEDLLRERMLASLSSTFGALASLVAAIGFYGMLSYMITRRAREIAIRVAVGARPGQLAWLTLRESLILSALGAVIGVPLSVAMSWFVRAQLFGVSAGTPTPIAVAVVTMVLLAAAAAWIPTRRATQMDPNTVLRAE
jgi:predicted permease